jgi:hypothetical protein
MTMHTDHSDQHNQSFIHTAGGQTTVMLAVLLVLTVLAWLFVW